MTLLRSILFALVFYIGSIPLVIIAAIAALGGEESVMTASRTWARYHYFCVRHILGIRIVVEGTFPTGACVIAMKHESMLEAVDTLRLIERPAVVFKAELLRIPVWGAVARHHGVIPVAREAGSAALREMLKAAKAAVAADRPIVIFPEGTRVPPGQRPALRSGFAGLYKAVGLPVYPVAIASGRLWPRRKFLKHAGRVNVTVLDPIPPGLPRADIEARVHDAINRLNQ